MVKTTEPTKTTPTKPAPAPQNDGLPSLGTQPIQQPILTQQPPQDRTGSTIPKRADLDPQG